MNPASPRVGQIGLGSIGLIYAEHLVDAFGTLHVFDRDADRLERASAMGATALTSASAVASTSDVILVALPNPPAVEAVLLGADGVLAGARPGTVIVDLSTVSPQTSRRMHAAAVAREVDYLDAPVSGGAPFNGGVEGAAAKTITFMVGGDAEAFERARPVMAAVGSVFFHIGPSGSGSTIKLISNLLSGVYALVTGEAFALGAQVGLSPQRMLEVFEHTDAKSYFMTDYLVPRLLRGDLEPGFSVELQLKDHRLAAELGHEVKVPLFFNQLATQFYELMVAQGHGGRDVTEALPFLAAQAGVELSPGPAS